MKKLFHATLHPEIYHGNHHDNDNRRTKTFFEGWYFKIVDAQSDCAWAIIPGMYKSQRRQNDNNDDNDHDNDQDEAFIMTLDGRTHTSTYHSFPVDTFQVDDDTIFDICIGNGNRFWTNGLSVNLPELSGSITFSGVQAWPVSYVSPGIMGPFVYFPMECYHGVLSLDHEIHGQLQTPTELIDFEGGRGYVEKDWGSNFPQNWIWIQANHFQDSLGTSVSVSIARIPFYGLVFPGFIIGFWHQGELYRFTTYVGARLQTVSVNDNQVQVIVKGLTHRLEVVASRDAPTALLHMPTPISGMVPRVAESVGSSVSVKLFRNKDQQLVFEGQSGHGGLEVHGDISMLLHG